MKALLAKLGISLILFGATSPLVACTFNFYTNRVVDKIATSFANQTSSLIKSLVMSKELNADTNATNIDIMKHQNNSSITNLSKRSTIVNWNDLQSVWGVPDQNGNGKIVVNGFNPEEFLVGDNAGELTKAVKTKKSINQTLGSLALIKGINTIDNVTLKNLITNDQGSLNQPLKTFFTTLQANLEDLPDGLKIVKNLFSDYPNNLLKPIKQLLGNLVDGNWNRSGTKTPININGLEAFVKSWKDNDSPDSQPYSNWVSSSGTEWNLNGLTRSSIIGLLNGHQLADWSQADYNLYRNGTLINYLFWKISKDHEIHQPKGQKTDPPRYLGDIISNYVKKDNSFDETALIEDINQYKPYFLTNPLYILTIIEALIPIVKKYLLNMTNITEGVKNLTIGNGYPTDDQHNSYNLLEIVQNIKNLLNNKEKLRNIIKQTLGWTDQNPQELDTFTYDIKITVNALWAKWDVPFGALMNSDKLPDATKNNLVDMVMTFVNSEEVKSIIDNILTIVTSEANQYSNPNEGLNFKLAGSDGLEDFLINSSTGILQLLNTDGTVSAVNTMINSKRAITNKELEVFYVALGGQPKNDTFRNGSIIYHLQKTIGDLTSPISNILILLFGNMNPKKAGIADIIIKENTHWIQSHYLKYLDPNNIHLSKVLNVKITRIMSNGIETINLQYDFTYQINNHLYNFTINCFNKETINSFLGIRNFQFKSITLNKVDNI